MSVIDLPTDLGHDDLARLVPGAQRILEIGANDGEDTERLLRWHPRAKVDAFECDPRAIAKWRRRLTGREDRVLLFECALDEDEGEATFYQSTGRPPGRHEEWDKSGSLCRPTGHLEYSPWCTFDRRITVRTRTLDEWAAKWLGRAEVVDLVWMDTQGAEPRVIRGGPRTLARTRFLKLECHRQVMYEGALLQDELLALLPEFELLGRYGDDLLLRNADAEFVAAEIVAAWCGDRGRVVRR